MFDVQAENYFQVKFINCYLRDIISFTKNDIIDWDQSRVAVELLQTMANNRKEDLARLLQKMKTKCTFSLFMVLFPPAKREMM